MKRIAAIMIGIAALAAAGFLLLKAKVFSETEHERFLTVLWQLKHMDTAFNEDVLEARFSLTDNYDDLQAEFEQTRHAMEALQTTPAFIDFAGKKALERARLNYASLLEQRARLFERFKTQNALLANSRRYLPVALDELAGRLGDTPEDNELRSVADDLTRLALTCLAAPEEVSPEMLARLERIREWCGGHPNHREAKFMSSIQRHAKAIVAGNSEADSLTRQILALPSESSIGTLFQAYEGIVARALRRAQQYRLLLYAMSLLVVAGLAWTFWALRAANRTLEQRVEERTHELAGSEERFRTLCVNSPVGIYMADPAGRCSYANPTWEKISGLTLQETMGELWGKTLHPEDREPVLSEWLSATRMGQRFVREFRLELPGQQTRWVHSEAAPICAADGKITGFVGTLEDITERKQAEAALAEVNKQLLDVSRKAGMAEVATNVLHNIGNVLNSVNVSASLMAQHVHTTRAGAVAKVAVLMREHAADLGSFMTEDPKGRELPNFLHLLGEQLALEKSAFLAETASLTTKVDHIKEIVAMQQSFARVSGITETLKVTDLVEDALRINTAEWGSHDVQLQREYDAPQSAITAEKHKVLAVLVNLIRNAKQACDESGSPDKRLTVQVTNGGGTVKIALTDNGIGILQENLTRIFNHGFTTKKNGHGFGLHSGALAAREMQGSLNVYSEGVGKGATFTLELPCQPLHTAA